MADNGKYIPNDDTQNYPFCRLKFVVETFDVARLLIYKTVLVFCLFRPYFDLPGYLVLKNDIA